MKNQFRSANNEYENEKHIARKQKAVAKKLVKRSHEDRVNEYGLEDEDENEMVEYERYLKH